MKQTKDLSLGIISILIGSYVLLYIGSMKPGPAFFPRIVAFTIIGLGAIIAIMAAGKLIKGKKKLPTSAPAVEKPPKQKVQYTKVIAAIGCLLVYCFLLDIVGYTILTALLIMAISLILGYRNLKVMIPTAVVFSITLYLVFSMVFHIHFSGIFY